jgi:hypothetical protein
MNYSFKEEDLRLFYGENEIIDLNSAENVPFADIWNKSSKTFNMKYFSSDYNPIGLEVYPSDFMKTKRFIYAALMPINTQEGLDSDKIYTLESGKFIRFETTFGELTNGFIPKVYAYIEENKIPVDFGFDYEEYPLEFDSHDLNSKVFICMKYLGKEE